MRSSCCTDVLWPDFDRYEFLRALLEYQGREPAFRGGVTVGGSDPMNAGGKRAGGPAPQPVAERPRTASDLRKEEKAEAAAARQARKDKLKGIARDKTASRS